MSKGFTLLELLVVLAVAGVLMAVALPQFRDTGLAASRARGATSLFAALNQARSEAIARNRPVTICRRDFFKTSAFPECAVGSSGSWAQGWIIFQDSSGIFASTEPDVMTDIIAVFDPFGSVYPTTGSDDFVVLTQPSNAVALQFLSNGRTAQLSSFTLCERNGHLKEGRRVSVSPSGGVSLDQLNAADTAAACAG